MTTKIDVTPSQHEFASVVEVLTAVAVEARLRILWALLHGEHSVNDLAEHVDVSASAVSQHLRQLRELGLVRQRRQGNFIFYSPSCDHPRVRALVTEAMSHARHRTADAGLNHQVIPGISA